MEASQRTALDVAGVRLSLQQSGSGETAIFLHGAGGAAAWLPFYDALAGRHALIVPDHPGFGASADPDWIRSVPDVAMLYLEMLDRMDVRAVHLIGHSLGGWIASEMAIRDRSRLRTLTLIAPAGIRIKGDLIADNFMWTPEENARALFADQTFADQMLAAQPDEAAMDVLVRNRFAAAKFGWQPRWYDPDLAKWLRRARIPAHVLWGDTDRLIPPSYAAAWCDLLPNATKTIVERAGHLPHVEQADRVSSAVLSFLKDHAA